MMFVYLLMLGFALLSVGIAGIVASRHFVVMILSVEIILVGASLLALTLYSYLTGGQILPLLFIIWAIAALDVLALVVFYRYLAKIKASMDVTQLEKLGDR